MPLAFLAIGAVFLVAAVRGTVSDGPKATPGLISLLKGDFTGPRNFFVWIIALYLVGAIGYIPGFKPVANAMLALVILMLFISNRGVIAQFNQQIGATMGTGATSGIGATPQASTFSFAPFQQSFGG